MPEDRSLESDPSDHREAKKSQADDRASESDPSDHPETKKSQAVDRALESDPSEHPEAKKSQADGEPTVFFSTKKKNRALESNPSDDPEAEKSPADDTMSKLAQEIGENSRRNHPMLVYPAKCNK
ncbi:hypothetical protein P7K49_023699 [Saguinus oedipus]|uniref:Uncharacterized protein n=1 Tax=Saguinus oedipus TaxID=9490 RepID=A0ABQ9UMF8_SAGOE|nr:hypothetical protein P7K49_023699 [Saguinus oedipus]